MTATSFRRFGAAVIMLFAFAFSGGGIAKTHTASVHNSGAQTAKVHKTKAKKTSLKTAQNHTKKFSKNSGRIAKVNSKQEYSRNSAVGSLPDLRQYPSGTPRKRAFFRTVIPYINTQNAAITADRNWLLAKQQDKRWTPQDSTRLKMISQRYKVAWNGNTRRVPWNSLLERVDIIPVNMVATMAAAESGWGTSKLARSNNNLFGMKCSRDNCGRGSNYSHFDSVNESVTAYVNNLNTHPAYASFRKSRAQLRENNQTVSANTLIHKLRNYSTQGEHYNNYLLTMLEDNQRYLPVN